jgi:hypothetical protein
MTVSYHDIKYYPDGPKVARIRNAILFILEQFRGHVAECPYWDLVVDISFLTCDAKINYL